MAPKRSFRLLLCNMHCSATFARPNRFGQQQRLVPKQKDTKNMTESF
jgi:hypothetical protein